MSEEMVHQARQVMTSPMFAMPVSSVLGIENYKIHTSCYTTKLKLF